MSLPILKDGDRLTGEACIVPAYLRYCDACGCVRRDAKDWQFLRIEGMPLYQCPRHQPDEATP